MKLTKNKFVNFTVAVHLAMTSSFGFAEGTLSSANFNTGETNNTRTAKTAQELQQQVAERAKQSAQQSMNLVAAAEAQKKASKKKMIMFGAISVGLGVMAVQDAISCASIINQNNAATSEAAGKAGEEAAQAEMNKAGVLSQETLKNNAAVARANAMDAILNPPFTFQVFRKGFGSNSCLLTVAETVGTVMALKASLDAKKDIKRAKETIAAAKAANFQGEGGTAYGDTRTGEYADDSSTREGDAPTLAAMEFQRNAEAKAIKALNSISQKTKGKIAINPTKGTMIVGGKEYKLPEFDKKSLIAAGATAAQVDSAMSQVDSIASKVTKNLEQIPQLASIMNDSTGGDDFGGGGGGGGGGLAAYMQNQAEQQQMPGLDSSSSRIPSNATGAASLDGMSKNYNGEPIGVAQDELFGMMTRRYKAVESLNKFMQ